MLNRIISGIFWLGVAALLAAFGIGQKYPDKALWVSYLTWGGLVCLLVYVAGQWREIAGMFSRRQARYGALTGVSVLVVLGILVAVNYIGARQNKRWDLTTNQQFSLSDQSRGVLKKLDAPLQITVFDKDENFQRFRDRLREYEYTSKNVAIDYVDPDKKPAAASQNQIQQYGTLLFNYKGRSERITTDSEQDITTAIIKVVQGQQKKVYFTQGHGEKDPTSSDRDGYKAIADALGRENYTTDKLVLAQTGSVPDDAAIVVVAGPRLDFLPAETEALKKYLGNGGKLLLELDPPAKADSPNQTNLVSLAHDWGIDVGNDIILDASGMGQLIGANESVPVVANYPQHPITQQFRFMTAYPLARSVTPVSGGVNGHVAQGFAETSPRSIAKSDIKTLLTSGKASLTVGSGDKQGPITIGAAVSAPLSAQAAAKPGEPEPPKAETRVVVYGDSDFASNFALGIQGNRDLFMNTVGWLSQQENLISIRPKEAGDQRITMTATQMNQVTLMALLVIPGIVFGAGVYNWWRRR
jgi:ABC-type uncharacterized transport system involved in gliding motility auxiliary subunit